MPNGGLFVSSGGTGVVVVGSGGTAVSAIALTVAPLSVPPLSPTSPTEGVG
jgi:hypothetical protein